MLAKQYTCQPVGAYPRIPVHARTLPPVVGVDGRHENAAFYLAVNAFGQQRREAVYLFLQGTSRPSHKACRLGVEEVNRLVVFFHHLRSVVCRYAPPCFFHGACKAIYYVAHKSSFAFSHFGHHQGGQLATFGKRCLFVARTVAIGSELGKQLCTGRRPWLAGKLLAKADVAVAYKWFIVQIAPYGGH